MPKSRYHVPELDVIWQETQELGLPGAKRISCLVGRKSQSVDHGKFARLFVEAQSGQEWCLNINHGLG